MKSFSRILLTLIASAVLTVRGADARAEDLVVALDPDFASGLATLKQATGFIEQPADRLLTDWQPNLQLLVGFKAVEKAKRTLYFVELTTLAPPLTNATGQPWQPVLRTNDWSWSVTNKAQFVTTLYPVRVRVFDEAGQKLKEGQTPMPWGMMTNGLLDLCRLSAQLFPRDHNTSQPAEGKLNDSDQELSPAENDELMRTVGGGFLWMMSMLGDLQTVPAVKSVWEKSRCAVRMPGVWKMVTAVFTGFNISLEPQLKEVTLTDAGPAGRAGPQYRLPVEMKSGMQKLTRAEIIVGPPGGAEMLLAGIRSIRAVHPTKPQNEFLAQVLATGSCPQEK